MLSLFRRLRCQHSTVTIERAHPRSSFGNANQDKAAWTDEKGCYTFLVCHHCKALLNYMPSTPVYGEKTQ